MDENRIADAADAVISVLRRANKYIDETAPWILAKDENTLPRLKRVLYNLTETLVITTSLLEPFIPQSAKKAIEQLGCKFRDYSEMGKFGLLENGTKVCENPETLFERKDIKDVLAKAEEIRAKYAVKEEKPEEKIPEIGIEDFAKISLKVALVTAAEKVAKSKKLIKLTLKVGDEVRTVASGIAEYYTPEELVGKKVVLVANLKPAKLCGVESQGMVLCAEADGKVRIVTPEDGIIPDGATVR